MVNNPSFYSQTALADTSSITQITDGADFPHSGLIKALSDGLGQNYAISGFNITPTNATQGSVATGTIMRDGLLVTVSSSLNFTLTTTYTSGSDYGYHLIVVNSSDALALRTPTASNKVPHPTSGDTVIAVLTHTGTNPFNAQYLTVDKTANGLTVGFDSSGYTEVGEISATSSSQMLIQTTASNADIKLLPHGSGDVVLGGDIDLEDQKITSTTTNQNIVIEPNGSGKIVVGNQTQTVNAITSNGNRDLKLEANSGVGASITLTDGSSSGRVLVNATDLNDADILISKDVAGSIGEVGIELDMPNSTNDQTGRVSLERTASSAFIGMALASDSRDGIRFLTGDGSETERVRITDGGLVGIGTDDPQKPLHIKSNTAAIMRLQDSSGDGAGGSIYVEFYDENSRMGWVGYGSGGDDTLTLRNDEDGDLILATNSSTRLTVKNDGDVGIGTTSPSEKLEVNGTAKVNKLIAPMLDTVSSSSATYNLSKATNAGKYLIYSGTGTVNLPNSSTAGDQYTILNTSSGDITIGRNNNDINGASDDVTVGTFNGATCIAIGSNDWIVLGV